MKLDNDSQPSYGQKPQKQEVNKPIYKQPDLPKFENILINKAKMLYEEAKIGKRSRFFVSNKLEYWQKEYPQGRTNFNTWYNSPEAIGFKTWLEK